MIQFERQMLAYIQIILGVILGALILVQQSDASLGSAFGGDSLGSSARTRRGAELIIFRTTILIAILFVVFAFLNLIY